MAIGSWRQSPPVQRTSRPPPKPQGYPVLTGMTVSQGEALKQAADGAASMVANLPASWDMTANGGTGGSVATTAARKKNKARARAKKMLGID